MRTSFYLTFDYAKVSVLVKNIFITPYIKKL